MKPRQPTGNLNRIPGTVPIPAECNFLEDEKAFGRRLVEFKSFSLREGFFILARCGGDTAHVTVTL